MPPSVRPEPGDCPPVAAVRATLRLLFEEAIRLYDAVSAVNDLRPADRDTVAMPSLRSRIRKWIEEFERAELSSVYGQLSLRVADGGADPWGPCLRDTRTRVAMDDRAVNGAVYDAIEYMTRAASVVRVPAALASLSGLTGPPPRPGPDGPTVLQEAMHVLAVKLNNSARAMGQHDPACLSGLADWVRHEHARAARIRHAASSMLAAPGWESDPKTAALCRQIMTGDISEPGPRLMPVSHTGLSSPPSWSMEMSYMGATYRGPGPVHVIRLVTMTQELADAYLRMCEGPEQLEKPPADLQSYLMSLQESATDAASAASEWVSEMQQEMEFCVAVATGATPPFSLS